MVFCVRGDSCCNVTFRYFHGQLLNCLSNDEPHTLRGFWFHQKRNDLDLNVAENYVDIEKPELVTRTYTLYGLMCTRTHKYYVYIGLYTRVYTCIF